MGLDLGEAGASVMALVGIVQKGVEAHAALPPEMDETEKGLRVAKVVLPDLCDLAIQLKTDLKD